MKAFGSALKRDEGRLQDVVVGEIDKWSKWAGIIAVFLVRLRIRICTCIVSYRHRDMVFNLHGEAKAEQENGKTPEPGVTVGL